MADNNSSNIFGIDPKTKVVETPELSIRGHLLRWQDTAIQISNISMVSTADLPVPNFPIASILMILIGIALLIMDSQSYRNNETVQMIAILFFAVSAGLIISWYRIRQQNRGKMYLHLSLNSGVRYSFLFTNKVFMRQVLQVFANVFENDSTGNITMGNVTISLTGNTIKDSSGNFINVIPR